MLVWLLLVFMSTAGVCELSANESLHKLPLFLRTTAMADVVDIFTTSLTMEQHDRIVEAAENFARDHQKIPFYDTIFNTNMGLFEAMDAAVMRYAQRVAYIRNRRARRFAMEMTIIMECAFHVIFETRSEEWIDDLVDQWAKQFTNLDLAEQEAFAGEFPLLARDLKYRAQKAAGERKTRDLSGQSEGEEDGRMEGNRAEGEQSDINGFDQLLPTFSYDPAEEDAFEGNRTNGERGSGINQTIGTVGGVVTPDSALSPFEDDDLFLDRDHYKRNGLDF